MVRTLRRHDWYKQSIFYEVSVRGFFDASGNGIGDFKGLIEKLPYISDLGVTALWLLPFYPSPLRDDGYDIADYYDVHPDYGSLRDFEEFLEKAHDLEIRVIADLVINHTSSENRWFKEARRDRHSPYRDYYVWSDDPNKYSGARVIFCDTEVSNWTYDSAAGQHYWHRFYSHQPDLNYENPAVQEEMLKVVDFWLGKGLDGFRVDAVPYLYEKEGTNCENLEETHQFCNRLRAFVEARYPEAVLLAEANQWPEDVARYFGEGDEFHMCFNFPLMPRLFMAIRREDNEPVIDIISRLPKIPATCQWATFLRNHDELSLEMVTDQERDYMYREYAHEHRMRINQGIRRRLFPLMENNRRGIELLHSLLLTLPGSPILYYGDEIGMGDNIHLGDRNGVRTPMQWSGDRNAGFSKADPSRLYSPIITDPIYHFQGVNVEASERSQASFLNWLRLVIKVRQRYPAFAQGDVEFVGQGNRAVVAYLCHFEGQSMLVVNNLSRFCQYVELDLGRFRERTPIDCFSGDRFPRIGELPYLVTLGPHGFYWFELNG
jgi:maltose alpha-D-glucosyltransferase/alpha-amylase